MRSIDDLPIEQQQALYDKVLSTLSAGKEETILREPKKSTNYHRRRYFSSYHPPNPSEITRASSCE